MGMAKGTMSIGNICYHMLVNYKVGDVTSTVMILWKETDGEREIRAAVAELIGHSDFTLGDSCLLR